MWTRAALIIGIVAVLCIAPLGLNAYWTYIANVALVNLVAALGLNLVLGYGGQISLCHAGFMGIGAYTSAILITKLGVPFPLAMLAGGATAAIAGVLIGLPCLRLQGHYLALATLAFGEIVQMALVHSPDLTNGPNGLNLPRLTLGGISVSSAREVYYFLLPVALAAILLTRNIVRSKVGRGLTAMRDSDVAASCCGLSLMRNKVLAFTLSAFYAGIAGGLYAMTVRFIEPGDFGLVQSIAQLTMLVVGGLGTMTGAILGSIIMTLLPEALRGLNVLSELAYGVLLIGFVVFMPNGIQQIFRRARS